MDRWSVIRTPEVGDVIEVEIHKDTHGAALLSIAQACDAWPNVSRFFLGVGSHTSHVG